LKTIKALENDVLMQVNYLSNFKSKKPLSVPNQKKSIFCGTGDSFVVALMTEVFSKFNSRALDPLDLLKNKEIISHSHLFPISISGNTISNIKLSKITKNVTAITSNPKSRLSKACKNSIILKYPNSGIFTAGTIGFLSCLLTCITLVSKIKIVNSAKLFVKAKRDSKKFKVGTRIFVLGNLYSYPIAMYAAAKFNEILGKNAHYERIEQFSHMGLFSAKPGDSVIIFEEKNNHNSNFIKNLKKIGLNVSLYSSGSKNKISQIIYFTFVSQLLPLYLAKSKNQKECYFVSAKSIRNVSSKMIY